MNTATAEAAGFIRRMVEEKSGRRGKVEALRDVARDSKLPYWTLNNILIGRAKSVSADVRDRIRMTFIEDCRSQAARLLHEAEIAAAKGNNNDVLEGIADQIRALAAELEVAKGEAKKRPQMTAGD